MCPSTSRDFDERITILLRIVACLERAVSDRQIEEFIRAIREFINPESGAHLVVSNATLTAMEARADAWNRALAARRESERLARIIIEIRRWGGVLPSPSFVESENSVSKSDWLARRGQGSG